MVIFDGGVQSPYLPISDEFVETLGEHRINAIEKVLFYSLEAQARQSLEVAISGAMRWPKELRPEVLVDLFGKLV